MRIISCLLLLLSVIGITNADKEFQMKIGPVWPSALLDTKKSTAWDASLQSGALFDDIVSIGAAADFLWNNDTKEKRLTSGVYKIEVLQRTFMFPFMGYVSVSPAPDLMVQPCFSGYIGLNTMYFSYKGGDTINIYDGSSGEPVELDGNGWYMGLIWKIAGDAVVKLGHNSGLITGIEYQWSKPSKLGKEDEDIYVKRNMSGIGIRLGLKLSY